MLVQPGAHQSVILQIVVLSGALLPGGWGVEWCIIQRAGMLVGKKLKTNTCNCILNLKRSDYFLTLLSPFFLEGGWGCSLACPFHFPPTSLHPP